MKGLRDAVQTMNQWRIKVPCVNGDADRIRSVNHELADLFSCSGSVSFYAPNIRCANSFTRYKLISRKVMFDPHRFCQTNRLIIVLERAETEIRFALANSMFRTKMDIDRHGPRLVSNSCKNRNPTKFLLPTTVPLNI